MKIVADKNVPFLNGVFEPYADVVYMDGTEINRECLLDADALIIRTRTKCNEALLEGTPVKIIATAHADSFEELCSKEILKELFSHKVFDFALGITRKYGSKKYEFTLDTLCEAKK